MSTSDSKVERFGFGVMLCVALLMFFQPLVTLQMANGKQVYNVFDVRHGLSQLQFSLRVMATTRYSSDSRTSLVSAPGALAAAKTMSIPFSLRTASRIEWFVFVALGFCSLALLAHLFFRKAVTILSLLGGCAGAIAILHLMLMSSDLQSWTQILVDTAINSADDPSGLIRVASSFTVSPGFGLYGLTACLLLVPGLSFTRAIPRTRSVIRREQRVRLSQPISLRPVNPRYSADNCTSLDLAKGGLLVESSLSHYYAGMEVYLTRNVREGGPANHEEHGSVVRVEKMRNGRCRVAIRIIPEL